jgi:DNA-binding GntR family transcriptional regulator
VAERTELRSIQRTSLRDEAAAALRAAILGGELTPGSIHSAAGLANRLGVSPTPVREAMLALTVSGLVEALPNRGFRVTQIDDRDLDEIGALRLMLEVPAVALVIERASDASLEGLGAPLAALEEAAANSDVPGFLVADRAFHLGLLALAGNRRLVRIVGDLQDQTRMTGWHLPAATETLEATVAEDRAILEAIRARDVSAAQRIIAISVEHMRSRFSFGAFGRGDRKPPAEAGQSIVNRLAAP